MVPLRVRKHTEVFFLTPLMSGQFFAVTNDESDSCAAA